MRLDSNLVFSHVQRCFAFFALINKKIIINGVMTNKMAWNESMSIIKHVHII